MLKTSLKTPFKHLTLILIINLGVIYGTKHIQPIILFFVSARAWISQWLLQYIHGRGELFSLLRSLLSLLALPLLLALIPTAIYWLSKRRFFPYFLHVFWVIWLLQTTAIVVLTQV